MKNNKTITLTEGSLRGLIREFMAAALAGASKKAKRDGGGGDTSYGQGEFIGRHADVERAEGAWGDEGMDEVDEMDEYDEMDEGSG
jgi:hypothetical protein